MHERWVEEIAGTHEAVRTLAAAFPPESALPAADSAAMMELATEDQWASNQSGWGAHPVQNAHFIGTMQLRLGFDCAIGMCDLLIANDSRLYAPPALLRPVLEASGRALWVLEPHVGIRERVRRGVNARLTSLYAQKEIRDPQGVRERSAARIEEILAAARTFGFEVTTGKQKYLDSPPPGVRSAIRGLFEGVRPDRDVSPLLTLFGNAVSHAGTLALSAYITPIAESASSPVRPYMTGELSMSSRDANLLLAASAMALIRGGSARIELNGWEGTEWTRAAMAAMDAVRHTLEPYVRRE